MKYGELFDIVKAREGLGEIQSLLSFYQVASEVEYLHERNMAHRDIKLENVLVDDDFNAKLIDFGFALRIDPEADTDFNTRVTEAGIEALTLGTDGYVAPELIPTLVKLDSLGSESESNETPQERIDKFKAGDVFALGVMLFT